MKAAPRVAPASEFSNDKSRQFSTTCRKKRVGPSSGTSRLNSNPSAIPGLVNRSGNSLVSASVKTNPISRNDITQNLMACATITKSMVVPARVTAPAK